MNETVKVDEKVLNELKVQKASLAAMQRVAQLANLGHRTYVNQQLTALGLDPNKTYNIAEDGVVSLVESKPVKEEEVKIEHASKES